MVIGAPPCTAFSNIQNLNKERCDPVERHRKLIEGKVLLRFPLDVYRWQLCRGRYFVHERPATPTSWKLSELQQLSREPGVDCSVNDA